MRPKSIRARMTVGFALFITLLMLMVCTTFYFYTRSIELGEVDARVVLASQKIQHELRSGEHSLKDPAEIVREENDDLLASNAALFVVDARNHVMSSAKQEVRAWPLRAEDWRTTSFKSGLYTIVIAAPWQPTEVALRRRVTVLLGLSACVVLLSSLAAWFLVGRTLAPIDHLAHHAEAASAESLSVRLDAPSPDTEIALLVQTLNGLLARIEQTAAARGRFYAAASHELRTPLQALTGHLDVALSRKREAHEYEGALCEARIQAERLTTLVQDLLLLNQLDANTSRSPAVQLDLADICETELNHLRPLAASHSLNIELALPERCEITAPWNHIEMLVRNLLENAVKYARPGASVQVRLQERTLTIFNDCAPVAGWTPDKYFEPFFRPDASRNSQTGGNGLGLAICKAICTSNHWEISLHQESSGVRASVSFLVAHDRHLDAKGTDFSAGV